MDAPFQVHGERPATCRTAAITRPVRFLAEANQ
jgi:hypothetical protein